MDSSISRADKIISAVESLVDLEDKTCPCCRGQFHKIGEDVSERLGVVPAQFRVLVVRRPKYVAGIAKLPPAPRG